MSSHTSSGLPIERCLPEIVAAVRESTPVVLKAPPGAGKTTGVPPALLSDGVGNLGQIILVQPRRLAARTSASRIAKLAKSALGQEVGYQVRFDRKSSTATRLLVITTGILLRKLTSDPLLENVSCVILDEFHERSLDMDLALGMLQRIRSLRPELKLIVMSATLDPQPIVDFLGDAVAVTSEGRAFPVEVKHTRTLSRDSIDQQVASVLPEVLRATPGHVLVFLPGVGEIRRTQRSIQERGLDRDANVLSLYGDLSPAEQDKVLANSEVRKIILSTNVAETSITIPGVTGVIDSGQARVMRFDPAVGMPALRLEPISQASAEQRAGRAGRTQPGVCWRLWPANSHRARRERDTPEIERNDFCGALLTLAAWGERDATAFPWLSLPPQDSVNAARQLLVGLDAIDDDVSLTPTGQRMLALPLHPRIAKFMVAATQLGVADQAAIAAALLTERNPFSGQARGATERSSGSDVVDQVDAMEAFIAGRYHGDIQVGAAKQIQRVAQQLLRLADGQAGAAEAYSTKNISTGTANTDEALKRALLAAYPDRLARRRQPGSDRGLMVGGRGVKLDRRSQVKSGELFLCIDVDSKGSEALVRAASAVEPEWLDQRLIRQVDEPFFNPSLKAVVARRRRYFVDLMLAESPIECEPSPEVAALLFQQARTRIDRILPAKDKEIAGLIDRIRFLTEHSPSLELPLLDELAMEDLLGELCSSRTSFSQLQSAPWLDHLRGRYDYAQLQTIDREAPARMKVPSGNTIQVRYAPGKPPIMEVRIQELFGWKQSPRIAGGKVPIQLHLLGPNRRPQQITEDLANFWENTYAQVRKDLRRRYPKHHWPEDPTDAKATHNGLKPR